MGTLKQASKILSLFEETPGDQIQALLESGLLADLRDGNIVEVKRDDFRKLLGLKPLNPSLLEFIDTVTIPATTERFLACEKFILNYGRKAKLGVLISCLGNNFQEWFLEKVEESMSGATLRYAKLLKSSVDGPIMDELGDAKEATLAEIYALMQRQANGKEGVLLTNGRANIFYVLDANGTLRAVFVGWGVGGWFVDAHSVAYPYEWVGGYQVFSRNPSVTVAA